MTDQKIRDLLVFFLLVAIGVLGRWGQPEWAMSPIAAIGLLAGCYFKRVEVALLVPLSAMLISDWSLPGYHHFGVMAAVYVAMTISPVLGRLLRKGEGFSWFAKLAGLSLAPATIFFVLTNLAVWAWSTQPYYEKTLSGMATCFVQALPFYRNMLMADVGFTAVLFGAAVSAGALTAACKQTQTR